MKRQIKMTCRYLLIGISFCLSACATQLNQPQLPENITAPIDWYDVDFSESWVAFSVDNLPRLIAVQHHNADGKEQQEKVILSNETYLAGENYLSTDVLRASMRAHRVTAETLETVFAAEFPKMTVQIAETARENKEGAYNYALATRPAYSEKCVYAWQILPASHFDLPSDVKTVDRRYRYCANDRDVVEMLYYFDQSTIIFKNMQRSAAQNFPQQGWFEFQQCFQDGCFETP